jgi:integrase
VLSLLFNWGRLRGLMQTNPAEGVPRIRRPKDAPEANRPWTVDELKTVVAVAPPELRLAIEIAVWCGLRKGDVICLPWSAYDGQAIEAKQGKTGRKKWVPVAERLRTLLDGAAAKKTSPIIVVGARGKPFTPSGFRARFFALIRRLESKGKVGAGLTFHGLRHTLGSWLAESGAETRTIRDFLGHETEAMALHYSRRADSRKRVTAAVRQLEQKRN